VTNYCVGLMPLYQVMTTNPDLGINSNPANPSPNFLNFCRKKIAFNEACAQM